MIVETMNVFGMLALEGISEKIKPIFYEEITRLRQEGCHNGDYLIGINEFRIKKFEDHKIVIDKKSLENMEFTIYDDFQSYESILESQAGNEIIMGEQI